MVRFVFIVNPMAGRGDNLLLFHQINKAMELSGHTVYLRLTEKPGDAKDAAAYFSTAEPESILVSCGGDGTLNEILCGLRRNVPVLVLPMGSGNDFAKKLYGKGVKLEEVLRRFGFAEGRPSFRREKIDYISTGDRRSVNIMSFGYDTHVVARGKAIKEKHPSLSGLAYKLALLPTLFSDGFRFHMQAELEAVDDSGQPYLFRQELGYALMAFCNGSYYGGGICPAPGAVLNDGLLDLCYVDQVSIPGALPLIPKYVKGNGSQHKKVHTMRITGGHLAALDGRPLIGNCDGELFEADTVDFHIVPGGLTVCCPEDDML